MSRTKSLQSTPTLTYTLHQVSEMTNMSYKWLWRQCKDGRLPHYRFGKAIRMDKNQINAMLQDAFVGAPSGDLVPSRGSR